MDANRFFEPIRIGCNLNTLRQATSIQSYNSLFNQDNERLCSICQSNYINQQIIRKINHCEHFYHMNCLDEWFENNVKCPECQYDLRESIPRNETEPNIYTFLLNNTIPNSTSTPIPNTQTSQTSQTSQAIERLLQNIIGSSDMDTNINIEYYVPTIHTIYPPQTRQPFQPSTTPITPITPSTPITPITHLTNRFTQPQQSSQNINIPMDVSNNTNLNTNLNTNTRTSRNRRNRNKKNQNQKEKLDYIMNYQKENDEKMDFFEKELESLRLQLEDCKITNNNKYNSYNPLNIFKNLWN